MLNGKSIIITGANGALGRAVVDTAMEQGASIIAIDRVFDGERDGVRQIVTDLTDPEAVLTLLHK